ncbi:MAG: IclR family transcriptional regulator [bacterium]
MSDRDRLQSLEKGLMILELLSKKGSPAKLELLAQMSGIKKTSCFRVLKTLTHAGFLVRDPDAKSYWLGPKTILVGLAGLGSQGVREVALPFMRDLREKTGATVNLGMLMGTDVVFVERLQSAHIMESSLRVGSRLPAHCSSMGKAILAFQPNEEVEGILGQLNFERRTAKTITDKESFQIELQTVRERGFALNNEELEDGLFAVAGPLRDHTGKAVAAMNVSFPLVRHSKEKALKVFCPILLKACQEVSSLLGFRESRSQSLNS